MLAKAIAKRCPLGGLHPMTGRWEDGCVPHRSAYPMSLVDQWDQRVRSGVRQAGMSPKAGGLAPGQRCRYAAPP
jgi:hypothetical protein